MTNDLLLTWTREGVHAYICARADIWVCKFHLTKDVYIIINLISTNNKYKKFS